MSHPGTRQSMVCEDGTPLEYFVAGDQGPALVCLNALGQDLLVWRSLVTAFSKSHRVIFWKPRGTYEEPGRWRPLPDQLADLERIVARERVQECRLLTWCSGAKTGIEFARRSPLVSGLVLMSGTFKRLEGLEHLETAYEKDMLKMCQMVAQRHERAAMLMKPMKALLAGMASAPGAQAPVSEELKAMIFEPFEQAGSTLNYSLQIIDYLAHDIGPSLAGLSVPTLVLSGQHDRISSPAMSKAVAERVPSARYEEVADGTHYFMHENPEAVIGLVERFLGGLPPAEVRAPKTGQA